MKPDRILFAWDGNPLFAEFWPLQVKAWLKLGVLPTLVYIPRDSFPSGLPHFPFAGEEVLEVEDFPELRPATGSFNWLAPTALLWAAGQFGSEVVCTSGLDQLPLGRRWLDALAPVDPDALAVGFAGCRNYADHSAQFGCPYYPSSHLCGPSSEFARVLDVEGEPWHRTVGRLSMAPLRVMWPHLDPRWGLDEAWFSVGVASADPQPNLVRFSEEWFSDWCKRRIDRCGTQVYNPRLLAEGHYSELHGHRPLTVDERGFFEMWLALP